METLGTLKADEVAAILKVRKSRVYEMAREEEKFFGRPGIVLHLGKQIRFNRAALRLWIEGGGTVAANGNNESEQG